MKRFVDFIFLLLALAPALYGELAPSVYREMQKNAPEYLEIEVLSVRTAEGADKISVEVEAKVNAVTRSKSGLKGGEVIHIRYSRLRTVKPMPGPSPAPLLEKGKQYAAFLVRADGQEIYELAARGRSFEVVK